MKLKQQFLVPYFVWLNYFVGAALEESTDETTRRYSYDDAEWLHDPDGLVGSFYGTAVAMNSEYLAVGSIGDGLPQLKRSGSVYIYSTDHWKLAQKITPSNRGSNYQFGSAVAVAQGSSTIVVGSPYAKKNIDGAVINCGVVHVFELDSLLDLHVEIIELYPRDGGQYDEFGKAVAIVDDMIAVSAAYHDNGRGKVYIYHREDSVWQYISFLAADVDGLSYFGRSVAATKDMIAVSALHGNNATERSSAFVFEKKSKDKDWMQVNHLTPSKGKLGDEYGISISLTTDMLVIGARYSSFNFDKSGAAYVYEIDSDLSWSETAILTPADAIPFGFFGDTVAIGDGFVAVGCFGWKDTNTNYIVGAVYVMNRDSKGEWSESSVILSSHGSNNDFFSKALATSGKIVAVGAAGDDINNLNSGSAFHFDMTSSFHSSRYEDTAGGSTHRTLISLVVVLSICCCCYCVGCCPGKKWRRRFCRDYFGISIGKKKGPLRRRHIRDINDIQHAPLNLDDSLSGYEPYLNVPEESMGGNALTDPSEVSTPLDGDIEAVMMGNGREVIVEVDDRSHNVVPVDELLVPTTVDEDMGSLLL